MKEVKGSRDLFQSMAFEMEEKPTIEESQLSRKSRYFQRTALPKPAVEKTEKKRKKKKIQEDSSDDEMPPEPRKNRKKNPKPKSRESSIIEVVDLVTPAHSPRSFIDLTIASDDENFDPIFVEQPEIREEPETSPAPITDNRVHPNLPGKLPKWYSTRKSEREEREKENAEKRETRLKLEKEAEEVARKEEQVEHRRFRDRLRHQKKRELMAIQKAKDSDSEAKEPKKKKPRVEDEEDDGNLKKKKRVKKSGTMITDPSLNPATISLGTPELAPWAPPKPKKTNEAPPTSLDASPETMTTSPDSESPTSTTPMMLTEDEEKIRKDLEELEKIGGMEERNEIPPMPIEVDEDPLLRIDEPLFFEENPEFLRIPDNEIEVIEEGDGTGISDTFLSYFNDDSFPVAELDQYF